MLEALLIGGKAEPIWSVPTIGVETALPYLYINAAVGVYMDSVLINFGGAKDGVVNNELRYYQSSNKTMATSGAAGTVPLAKGYSLGCMVGDNFYVLGGSPGPREFHRWSWLTGTWVTLASPPRNVWGSSLVHYNGYLYMAGATALGAVPLLRYQISSGTWVALGNMPFQVMFGRMVERNGWLYFLGGYDYVEGGRNGKCYFYNIAAGTWGVLPPLLYHVSEHTAVVIGSRIYVMGGADNVSKRTNAMQVYDVPTNTWYDRGVFGPASNSAQAAVMNGKIYLFGGTEAPVVGENLKMHIYKP